MDSTAEDDSVPDEPATKGESSDGEQNGADDSGRQTTDSEDSYTAQPAALRRQQFLFAVVGSLIGGGALAVSLIQRYPAYRTLWILAGGMAGILLFRLISGSIFPGEVAASDGAEDSEGSGAGGNSADDSDTKSPDSGTSTE
ncbi:hypothetical protein [Halovenus sp. HT40]|uniref:hypothetical protein n=1 Tax=Halovenus sp. HT40 TaxID=3126691 RepID=UPI00300EBEA2